jgi:hypothetical protein
MVTKEINEIFEHTTLAKTAAYEAGLHSGAGNEQLCEAKIADLKARMKEIQRMMTQLDHKIEYIKNQS